jgi:hypothetical protein
MKVFLLNFSLFFFFSSLSSQRYTVHIQSYGLEEYNVYIDDVPQSLIKGLNYKIQGVPLGEKAMKIVFSSPSKREFAIKIGTTGKKEEYYTLTPQGKSYSLALSAESFRFGSRNMPVFSTYNAKRKPVILDSTNRVQTHTCELSDSAINDLIANLAQLKDEKSKEKFQDAVLRYKCLLTYQIRALAARFTADSLKLKEYKKHHVGCNDKNRYAELYKTFQTEIASQEFRTWLGQQ